VLSLQPSWASTNTPQLAQRGTLIRRELPRLLARLVPDPDEVGIADLDFEGRDGTGRKTRVPWVRAHSRRLSPSATQGWYVVYLFAFDGSRVFVSLNQDTTTFEDGEYEPRDAEFIARRVEDAREQLAGEIEGPPRLLREIDLRNEGSLGQNYDAGNVVAFAYDRGDVPGDSQIEDDLVSILDLLARLYNDTGADATDVSSAVHLLLKWSPNDEPQTIKRHGADTRPRIVRALRRARARRAQSAGPWTYHGIVP
jgi:hypothetical protein